MIRTVKHKSGEFIVVNSHFEIKGEHGIIKIPLSVQVDITSLNQEQHYTVHRAISHMFNRTVTVNQTKPKKTKESWWKQLFNK